MDVLDSRLALRLKSEQPRLGVWTLWAQLPSSSAPGALETLGASLWPADCGDGPHRSRGRLHCGRSMSPWSMAFRALCTPAGLRPARTPPPPPPPRTFRYAAWTSGSELGAEKYDQLAQLLELGVFLNRCLDGKGSFCSGRYRSLRSGLPQAPLRRYLRALRICERSRPSPPDGDWASVCAYRREVSDLSLMALFEVAEIPQRPVLSPLVGLVQLVDDILDQEIDHRLGLPNLLGQGAPSAREQAVLLWKELRGHRERADAPLVGVGFSVYLLARLLGHLYGRR